MYWVILRYVDILINRAGHRGLLVQIVLVYNGFRNKNLSPTDLVSTRRGNHKHLCQALILVMSHDKII